jgi:predicted transcriptional regulator of viral defense system
MKDLENTNTKWDSFFLDLQERGRYTFTFDELRNRFPNLSDEALLQGLYRYKVKKQVAQIRKSFYAIISPEYSKQGMLPPYMFIDDLMKSLNKPYYVALVSAAALHGAAHQQPQVYFVITQTPAPRSIQNSKLKITFISKTAWDSAFIIQKKTNAGYMNVSSPELTALDLLAYSTKFGLNRVSTILQELSEEMKPSVLSRIAKKYPTTPVLQRLGYILDRVLNEEKLADSLCKILIGRQPLPVPLSIEKGKNGEIDEKWNIIKNMEIESDL